MNAEQLIPNTEPPLIYALFIGGAADKTSFLWGDIEPPLIDKYWPHKTVHHLANMFNYRLLKRINKTMQLSTDMVEKHYRFDYLGYDEICYPEIKNYDPTSTTKLDIVSPKFKQLCQNLSDNTHIYIVGHSLGGWNGAHLSRILADYGHPPEMLITLDPVGTGNHEFTWTSPFMKQAQIYKHPPIPVTKKWINIRGFKICLAEKNYSRSIEDWVAWAGGQWLINSLNFNRMLLANELTNIAHKQAECMFHHHCADLGYSAAAAMEQSMIDALNNNVAE